MIAQIWHGVTLPSKGDNYLEFMKKSGLRDYRKTGGNRGAYVLRRREGDKTHFLTLSFWDSFDAIKAFAGEAVERPVYYAENKDFLLEFEPRVLRYEVTE